MASLAVTIAAPEVPKVPARPRRTRPESAPQAEIVPK
jgi:hypothetical protein